MVRHILKPFILAKIYISLIQRASIGLLYYIRYFGFEKSFVRNYRDKEVSSPVCIL